MKYFANQNASYGGGWAISETPEKAASQARANVGITAKEASKVESYVLEFPDDAEITINSVWGGVSWTKPPTNVVKTVNMTPERVAMLRLQCVVEPKAHYQPDADVGLSDTSLSGWRVLFNGSRVIADNLSGLDAQIIANALNLVYP